MLNSITSGMISGDTRTCHAFRLVSLQMLVLTILILSHPPGTVNAQGYSRCAIYGFYPQDQYLGFDSDEHISGAVNLYGDSDCLSEIGTINVPADGWARAESESEAIDFCDAALGGTNTVLRQWDIGGTANQNLWQCHNSGARNGNRYKGKRSKSKYYAKKIYLPPTGVILNQTDLRLSAVDGLDSGIQFQRVGRSGVGFQFILDMGFLDAVDVWSHIGGGYEVCFAQIGRIVFLDAVTSPRTVSMDVDYDYREGYTCAALDRAGTVVLVKSDAGAGILPELEQPLSGCSLTTTHRLNLRDAANGAVIQVVIPTNSLLTPSARTMSWFRVVYAETGGWVSERFVETQGDCAYIRNI